MDITVSNPKYLYLNKSYSILRIIKITWIFYIKVMIDLNHISIFITKIYGYSNKPLIAWIKEVQFKKDNTPAQSSDEYDVLINKLDKEMFNIKKNKDEILKMVKQIMQWVCLKVLLKFYMTIHKLL